MSVANIISSGLMPAVVMIVVIYGVYKRTPLLDIFSEGAKNGLMTVFNILPVLIALMCASSVFVKSGMAEIFQTAVKPITDIIHFPSELMPLLSIKMFSSSAATGLITEIFKSYGPDSYIGRTASVMLACTETVFYTMSVYFSSVNVKNTRYTLFCCLVSVLCGTAASAVITCFM